MLFGTKFLLSMIVLICSFLVSMFIMTLLFAYRKHEYEVHQNYGVFGFFSLLIAMAATAYAVEWLSSQ